MIFYCSEDLESDSNWSYFWQLSMRENWEIRSIKKLNQKSRGYVIISARDHFEEDIYKFKSLSILAEDLDARFFTAEERNLKALTIDPTKMDEWEEFASLVEREDVEDLIDRKSKETIKKFSDEGCGTKKNDQVLDEVFEFNLKIKDLDFDLEIDEMLESLNKTKKPFKTIGQLSFVTNNDESTLNLYEYLYRVNGQSFSIVFNEDKKEIFLAAIYLSRMLQSVLKMLDNLNANEDIPILFQHAIAVIEPMALMNEMGGLLYYNEAFSRLNFLPSDCLNFTHDQLIEANDHFYKYKKYKTIYENNTIWMMFFIPDTTTSSFVGDERKSNEELGIISSSIAHELNNPIAGVIAATSVLELEEWDEDSSLSIKEIKESAIRCKQLIEVFLGFSRFSPAQNRELQMGEVENSIEQARQLIRFRMIQNNFKVDLKKLSSFENFSAPMNCSVLAMIIYLILSEVLTAFEHYRLLGDGRNQSGLNIYVTEFSNQIIFQFDFIFDFKSKIISSKLIKHLLEHVNLNLVLGPREIKLVYNN